MNSCPTQFPLCCIARSEPPPCFGIMGKAQYVNIERNVSAPAGRPVRFLPPSFDTGKLHNSNCDFYTATVWKTSQIDMQMFTEDFRITTLELDSSRIAGLCAEVSFWLNFCILVCVFLIQFRDQCLSEFANPMSANPYLGFGIPQSVLGYLFHKQR